MLPHDAAVLLYLFRMERDAEYGLRQERVTYSEYEQDVYNYCLFKLGSIFRSGRYVQQRVNLRDMNGTARPYAMIPKHAVEDFTEYCDNVEAYTYPPYGPGAASFGYHSKETIAWIQPHRDIPVLLFKATDGDNVIAVSEFMGACTELGRVPPWPKQPEIKTILTPTGRVGGRMRPGAMRKARAAKKLQRALHRQ